MEGASNSYKIVRGIRRFVNLDGGYSENFGIQWKKWSLVQYDSHNIGGPMEGYTEMMFDKITQLKEEDFKGKLILDIGSGAGRFVEIARKKGATVVGIDYSEAIEVSHKNHKNADNVFFVQGDALNLPFAEGVFDGVYSIGVLHHTPDPEKGVQQGTKSLKKGGWFALAVYEKGNYFDN